MGLLSRIGKNISSSFAHYPSGGFRTAKEPWTIADYAVLPVARNAPVMAAPASLIGGALGSLSAEDGNDLNSPEVGSGMMTGALVGAGLGAGVPYAVLGKRVIVAIAKAMKKQMPELADDEVLQRAAEAYKNNPTLRQFFEKQAHTGVDVWGGESPRDAMQWERIMRSHNGDR